MSTPLDTESISRADKIIDSVCQSSRVTSEGKKWLKLAIDPFPDETRTCGGYPDMISSKSNVVPLAITSTISTTLGVPWDCHIAFQGIMDSCPVVVTNATGNVFSQAGQGATPYNLGGLQVRSAATGTTLDIPTITGNLFPLLPTDRPWRLISSGIEVHNMTEPLYRSGKVVCYRQPTVPQEKATGSLCTSLVALDSTPTTIITSTPLPETLANANNIPNSTNWDAEEGAYIVFAQDGPENRPNVFPEVVGLRPAVKSTSNAVDYFPAIAGTAFHLQASGTNSLVPFNNCGMYFADLSPQTKLDLVWHLVIEQFPPVTDRTLTALSDPSAAYDPEALVLYSRALRQLPIAVPVSENGLGTFFLEAAKSIASWMAPKLLKGLDDPSSKDDRELDKIKTELEVLRELTIQQRSMRLPTPPRVVVSSPNGNSHIIPAKSPKVIPVKPTEPRTKIVTNTVRTPAPVRRNPPNNTNSPDPKKPRK